MQSHRHALRSIAVLYLALASTVHAARDQAEVQTRYEQCTLIHGKDDLKRDVKERFNNALARHRINTNAVDPQAALLHVRPGRESSRNAEMMTYRISKEHSAQLPNPASFCSCTRAYTHQPHCAWIGQHRAGQADGAYMYVVSTDGKKYNPMFYTKGNSHEVLGCRGSSKGGCETFSINTCVMNSKGTDHHCTSAAETFADHADQFARGIQSLKEMGNAYVAVTAESINAFG